MLRRTASGPASQMDMGRIEGQRVYYNNKPLVTFYVKSYLSDVRYRSQYHQNKLEWLE